MTGKHTQCQAISGVILAGGNARRMGYTNKLLSKVSNTTLFELLLARLQGQVGHLAISINQQYLSDFSAINLPTIIDESHKNKGPLIGILTGIKYAQQCTSGSSWLMCVAGDTPLIPENTVHRLHQEALRENTPIAIACSSQRDHYCVSLWHQSLAHEIEAFIEDHNNPSIKAFIRQQKVSRVNFNNEDYDPFFNVNTPDDLKKLSTFLDKSGLIRNKTHYPGF